MRRVLLVKLVKVRLIRLIRLLRMRLFCMVILTFLFVCRLLISLMIFIVVLLFILARRMVNRMIVKKRILRATLTFTTRIPLWLRSLLLLTWTQAMTLWQELQIELKTSVWVGVLGLLRGVGMLTMTRLSRLVMFLLAPLEMCSMLSGL